MTQTPPSPLRLAGLIAVLTVVTQALLVPMFAAPVANLSPRDVPVVLAGPAAASEDFVARLAATHPGEFTITTVPDEAAADRALREREAYAAFLFGPDGLALHTASAASPLVEILVTDAVWEVNNGAPARTVEVVEADPDDERGAALGAGFLPLAMISMLVGGLLFLLGSTRLGRLAGLVTFGVVAGLAGAGVLHGWLGILPGDYWAEAGAIGLFALGAAAIVVGLGALLGRAGLGLGALLLIVIGNPLSGVTSAPELLPQPWGTLGQWLPVGAGGSLLRSAAFFDGAGAGMPMAILAGYTLLGVLLLLINRGVVPSGDEAGAAAGAAAAGEKDHVRAAAA